VKKLPCYFQKLLLFPPEADSIFDIQKKGPGDQEVKPLTPEPLQDLLK
jgi:hypothetical protein